MCLQYEVLHMAMRMLALHIHDVAHSQFTVHVLSIIKHEVG